MQYIVASSTFTDHYTIETGLLWMYIIYKKELCIQYFDIVISFHIVSIYWNVYSKVCKIYNTI